MALFRLTLLLLSLAGCHRAGVAGVETIITLHSGVASVGVDVPLSSACAWIIGRTGTGTGLSLIVAHGAVTVDECAALGPP